MRAIIIAFATASTAACHDAQSSQAARDFEGARRGFRHAIDIQESFILPTCSPNPGVCHQGKEYPELFTVGSLLAGVDAPCNLTPPAPELGWDACERLPYRLILGGVANSVAWSETMGPAIWSLGVYDPIAADIADGAIDPSSIRITDPDGNDAFAPADEWSVTIAVAGDRQSLTLTFVGEDEAPIDDVVDGIMASVVTGDPNRNGVWGAFEGGRASLVAAGDLDQSYLWRRLIGDVPGDRMPLANGPVTNDQMLALGCWIEGLSPDAPAGAQDEIDYDGCSFAADPPVLVETADDGG